MFCPKPWTAQLYFKNSVNSELAVLCTNLYTLVILSLHVITKEQNIEKSAKTKFVQKMKTISIYLFSCKSQLTIRTPIQRKALLQPLPRKLSGTIPRHFITQPFSEYLSQSQDEPKRLCFENRVAVITGAAEGRFIIAWQPCMWDIGKDMMNVWLKKINEC